MILPPRLGQLDELHVDVLDLGELGLGDHDLDVGPS